MSYNKQNFVNGQPLTAQQLNYMENGLVQLNAELNNVNTEITNIEDNYATKDFVRSEINNAEIGGDGELDVDLSIYALKTEIPKYIQTGALPDSTIGYNATVEGASNIASGDYSHAEGVNNKAIGSHSHAEGANTQATEVGAHAEGSNSSATGGGSHAEGNYTEASGKYSHAEGYGAKASGVYSHAEGVGTIAAGDYQHVQGMFNKEDTTSQYAFIVGNGYSLDDSLENAERSNAYTLDWDGNAWFAGAINCEDKTTTLANLGAAPAVYTYPSVNGIDANTIVNEYHKFVINCSNCAYDHGFLDVEKAGGEGFTPNGAAPIIRQTMRDWSTGHKAYRVSVDNGATWGEWVKEYTTSNKPTPAEIGAAPSGYGLGEYSAKQVDWGAIDSVTKPGWYRFASGITIGNAWEVASPYMRVDAWDANSCVQTLYSASAPMRKLIRVRSGGVWQDWEFEAVPGYPGYEARLTERWNGKPVYWKLISMGTCAAAGSAVRKQHGISATNFISCRGIIIDGKGTAHELVAGNMLASCYVESGHAIIHSKDSITSYQGYVELKYTK